MKERAKAAARREALAAVRAGDIVHGVRGGVGRYLLVYRVGERHIYARLITSQTRYLFGRSGKSHRISGGGPPCEIVSVATLPDEDYTTAIGLDRKMRTGRQHPDWVLSEAEILFLRTAHEFFEAHPLPEYDLA